MNLSDFDFPLPRALIAQHPLERRADSRLMVLHCQDQTITHSRFYELDQFLDPTDVLVFNNSKVIPACLLGQRLSTGANVELTLTQPIDGNTWRVMTKSRAKTHHGDVIVFPNANALEAVLQGDRDPRTLEIMAVFNRYGEDLWDAIYAIGYAPLPPYIRRKWGQEAQLRLDDLERYQTIYAKQKGSIAAPTAGLHFDKALMARLRARGHRCVELALHVGLGTFKPISVDDITGYQMHSENYEVPKETMETVQRAYQSKQRVIAVGTTSTRVLETLYRAAAFHGSVAQASGMTEIFIYPPQRCESIQGLVTNFHLPKSTLLLLVAAFAGRDFLLHAYREAIGQRYRFFSYGDAMLILS